MKIRETFKTKLIYYCLNFFNYNLFLWQAVTGMQIVNKIWENRPA